MAGGRGGSGGGGRSGGGGGGAGQGGGEQIIPLGDGTTQVIKKKGLLDAIGDIQYWYVMEKDGTHIDGDWMTLPDSLEYWKIGAKSGFNEALFVFLAYPIMEFWLLPFVLDGTKMTTTLKISFNSLPYLMVLFNTLLCLFVSKFYIGQMTRKVINSIFIGRSMALFAKGVLIFLLYWTISAVSTPDAIWKVAKLFGHNAQRFYYGFFQIKPLIASCGLRALVFMSGAAFVPYGLVYVRDFYRQYKIRRNTERISGRRR